MDVSKELKEQRWIFAKTYAKFAPHEYFVEWQNPVLFSEVSKLIETKGFDKSFSLFGHTKLYRYLVIDGFKYWFFKDKEGRGGGVLNREPIFQ